MKRRLPVVKSVAVLLLLVAFSAISGGQSPGAEAAIAASKWTGAGQAARKNKDYATAIADYKKAIQIDSNYASAWFDLGAAYTDQQQFEQAIPVFRKYLTLPSKPDEEGAWLFLGMSYINVRQYSGAAEAFRSLIRITNDPGFSFKAHYELGHSLCMLNQFTEAVDELQEAIRLEGEDCKAPDACVDSENIRSYLGLAFYRLKRYPEALQAFHEAARLKPDDNDNIYFLGLTYVQMGQKANAFAKYQQLLSVDKKGAADLYDQINKMNGGSPAAESTPSSRPASRPSASAAENPNPSADECKKTVDSQDYAKGFDLCKKAVAATPFNAELWSQLGMASFGTKHYPEAIQAYEQVTRLKPNDAHAHYGIGAAYVETKQYSEAVPHLREAVRLDSSIASQWYDLGHSLFEIKQYANAAQALERAASLQPNDSATDYWLGRTYVQLGKKDAATEAYNRLVGADGNTNNKLSQQLYTEINQMK